MNNPLLGEAVFTHDASGRLTSATAGDLVQDWAYRHGSLSEHSRVDRTGPGRDDVTLIGRDGEGRITGLTRSGAVTRYGYDGAGQMVSAATTRNGDPDISAPASVSEWVYDAGGRLIGESTPAGSRVYEYDAAGQLLAVTDADGTRTEYVHDGLGRRTRLIRPDGSWTEYAWGQSGQLKSVADRTPDGMETSRHELWVDALGELAGIDGSELWWDTANPIPTLTGIGGGQVLSLPGGVTGIGDAWTAPGWRAARPTDQTDPWAVLGTPAIPDPAPGGTAGSGAPGLGSVPGLAGVLPAGISLTGNGGVDVAGLEWLGARAYDPATRGFLSTDPLAPVLGAGWDGNPYAYAGNNPLNTTDPTGLRPLTDADLKAYDGSTRGAVAAAGEWWDKNKEYVAGGLAFVAGAVLMFVPGGQVAGMGLMSFGADVVIQKATTGKVDWGQAAMSGVLGLAGGGVGMVVTKSVSHVVGKMVARQAAERVASNIATSTVTRGTGNAAVIARRFGANLAKDVVGSGVSGGVAGTVDYARERFQKGGPWTAQGFFGSAAGGGAASAISGGLSPAAGHAATKGLQFALNAGINTGAGFAGDMVKSGVNGEAFDPIKSLASSGTAGTFSTAVSTSRGIVPQGYGDVIGTSTASPVGYFTKSNMTTDVSNSLIGLGTNGMTDEMGK